MSPRTNSSAPESGHGGCPEAEPAGPAAERETARADASAEQAADTAPAPGPGETASTAEPGSGTGAPGRNTAATAEQADEHQQVGTTLPDTPTTAELAGRPGRAGATAAPTGSTAEQATPPPADTGSTAEQATPPPADTGSTAERATPPPADTGSTAESAGEPASPGPAGGDERIVALRRFSASGRRWRSLQLGLCAASLAVALTAGAVVVGAVRNSGTAPVAATPGGVSPALLAGGDLDSGIRALQAHLRAQPRDHGSWATLALAYVEQARTKGDPSRYPQAQRALDRSLRLRPGNDAALAGRAALAAARHDFAGALTYADQALQQNPYSERALSSRVDALVELGRYSDASKAADLADARRPGVPVFTRYAYVHELRGDVTTARRVLEQALGTATSRGDIAYVATALGQLAWSQGRYTTALAHYARALAADDAYLPALEGRARAQAARGDTEAAIRGMEQVVDRAPLPQSLVELGELYEARGKEGDRARAHDQYALVDAWVSLARANGVDADLDTALAAADHGDRAAALRAARAEWARRHTVHTADALAWALHMSGRDREALPYARQATATGYRNAAFLYHRGMIERATGRPRQARASLTAALRLNAGFSPLGSRTAREALEAVK